MAVNLSSAARKAATEAWAIDGLDGSKLGLYANDVIADPNRPFADLTEPTFTGYAVVDAAPVAEGAIVNDQAVLPLVPKTFQATAAPGAPITIYGWFVRTGGNVLQAMEALPVPVVITNDGDFVAVSPVVRF